MTTVVEWSVGDRLAKARRSAGVGSSEMCEFLGIHRNSLNAYEHDRVPRGVPLAILRLWALRCDVPLDWLRYGDVPPMPEVVAAARPPARKGGVKQRKRGLSCIHATHGFPAMTVAA